VGEREGARNGNGGGAHAAERSKRAPSGGRGRPAGPLLGRAPAVALAACAALGGCQADRDDWVTEPLRVVGPMALGSRLVYVEQNRGELLAVDVQASDPSDQVARLVVGEEPGEPQVVPGADAVSAPRALALMVPRERALQLLTEGGDDGPELHTVELDQAYDRVAFSADGAWAVTWMGEASEQADFITLAGKIAVVDVVKALADEDDAVTERSLHLEEAPSRVVFSEPLELLGGRVTLAAVVTPTRIAVVDLAEPDRRSRTIFLDPGVHPRRMRFTDGLADDPEAEYLLFNADGDAGISAYRILGVDPAPELPEPRIQLTYHQLLPDDRPADFEVFAAPGGTRYMLVSVGARVHRATVMESLTTPVGTPVDLRTGPVNRVLRAALPGANEVAVLYDDSGSGRTLQHLSLPADADERPQVEAGEDFVEAVREVHTVAGQPGMALVFLYDSTQIELVDLGSLRSTPVRLSSRPLDMTWDRQGSELYLAVSDDNLEEGDLLVRVRVVAGGLVSESLALDHAPRTVHLLEDEGVAVVTHAAGQGLVTAADITRLEREEAWSFEGFFLTGLLDAAAGRTP